MRAHSKRRRHHRLMAVAVKMVELARVTLNAAEGDPEFDTSWWYTEQATKAVVRCGCDSELWPLPVRQALGSEFGPID